LNFWIDFLFLFCVRLQLWWQRALRFQQQPQLRHQGLELGRQLVPPLVHLLHLWLLLNAPSPFGVFSSTQQQDMTSLKPLHALLLETETISARILANLEFAILFSFSGNL
jgi:hypothetical protein